MHASFFRPTEFKDEHGTLERVDGVYCILNEDASEVLYVGQTVNLENRLRTHFAWISPGTKDSAINKISGAGDFLHSQKRKGKTKEKARKLLGPTHDKWRKKLNVAVIAHPDISLNRLETDLINWFKPPYNGAPQLSADEFYLDNLDERLTPYLAMLETAVEEVINND